MHRDRGRLPHLGEERVMDATIHNGIERCPGQCTSADIRVWNELRYGPRKASVVGVDVYVTCAHKVACRRLTERLADRGE